MSSDEVRAGSPARPKKRAPFWARWLRIGSLLGLPVVILMLMGWAERLFYYPLGKPGLPGHPSAQEVWFESEGRRLHGWFYSLPPPGSGVKSPTIVHCHGNAAHLGRHADFVEFLLQGGFNVLLFDYRSYGLSERGPLHRDGLVADAIAAIDYVMTRDDVDPERIGMYGLSLGGTIGLAAAAEHAGVRAVASVATFSSWKGVAGDYVPLLGPLLVPLGRDAVDSVARLGDRPLMILHGTADEIVPFRHAPMIHDAARDAGTRVEFIAVDGAGHVDWVWTHPEVPRAITAFFREHLGTGPQHP